MPKYNISSAFYNNILTPHNTRTFTWLTKQTNIETLNYPKRNPMVHFIYSTNKYRDIYESFYASCLSIFFLNKRRYYYAKKKVD